MKRMPLLLFMLFFAAGVVIFSCKKETANYKSPFIFVDTSHLIDTSHRPDTSHLSDTSHHPELIINDLIWQRWHQSNWPVSDSSNDEIYLIVPNNLIYTISAANNFDCWVKKDSVSAWETVYNPAQHSACPFWYSRYRNGDLLIEVCITPDPWIWSLPGKKASVKLH